MMCLFHILLLCAATVPRASARVVYSVGDLHGDFGHFKRIVEGLGLAVFTGENALWTGGDAILVSTGDSVDRGIHSRQIYNAFAALAEQAPWFGGEVVNILGNHELMNLQADFRFVDFAEYPEWGGAQARREALSPNGRVGWDLRLRYHAAVVREGTLFVHAGLRSMWLKKYGSLENLNKRTQELISAPVVTRHAELFGSDGPFWTRFFATAPDNLETCGELEETLRLVGAERMTVGHTIQKGGVRAACRGKSGSPQLFLADTAISRAYGKDALPSAVEYNGDRVTAIYFQQPSGMPERHPLFSRKDVIL